MSDSFADLWNLSAPSPAKQKPLTLAAAAAAASRTTVTTTPTATATTSSVQSHKARDVSHAAWAGLDSLEGGISQLRVNPNGDRSKDKAKVHNDKDEDEDILGVLSKPVNVIANKNLEIHEDHDDEDIFGVLSKPVDTVSANKKLEINLDDDDDILGVLSKPVDVVIANKRSEINQNHDEEDTLDVLSRPADVVTPNKNWDQRMRREDTEIGFNVLGRASAFWKQVKEKVVEAILDERGETVEEGPSMDLFSESSRPIPTIPTIPQPHTRTYSRPPPRPRPLPTTSTTTLSLASTHKNTGTSQFKLGQYGPASESYTSAIALLPPNHLLLIPLFTNRSLARLKCGEYVGAGEDAGEALKIICIGDGNSSSESGNVIWNPDTERGELIQGSRDKINQSGWLDTRGVGVDLADGYIKALRRRAEAWEGREKWVEAGRDWEILAGGGAWIGEGVKKEAVRGAGRCRRMLSQESSVGSSSSAATSKRSLPPRSKPPPLPPRSSTPSKALRSLKSTTLQAEADDTLKHQLKDSVDARIAAWKNGKETNIRALLVSLDMVLWDDILSGGVKVKGLGELVTAGQVKKGYLKAIGRVHPDKLNTSNSTVEQRMLANSVFAALNEAWIAFQSNK